MKKLNNLIVHCASSIVHQSKTLTLLLVMLMSVNMAWGADKTYSFTPNAETSGSSSTSYVTTAYSFTYNKIGWSFNQWNPSTLQIKTNQSSAGSEFNFKNTSAFPGKIKSVVITFKALTVSDASKLCFIGGSSAISSLSGGSAGTWNSTAKTLTWTPASTTNYTYFAFYQNGKAVSGTNYLAESDAIVITYEAASNPVTTLYLSVAGTLSDNLNGTYNVGDKYTLPDEVTAECGGKTFVGWSTETVDSPTEPTSNFYEPGAEVTLAANNIFYAVFADASIGKDVNHDYPQSLSQLLNNNASIASINIDKPNYIIKQVIISYKTNKSDSKVNIACSVAGQDWGNGDVNSNKEETKTFSKTPTSGAVTFTFTNKSGSGTGKGTFSVSKVTLVESGTTFSNYTTTCATLYPVTASASNGKVWFSKDGETFDQESLNMAAGADVYFKLIPAAGYEISGTPTVSNVAAGDVKDFDEGIYGFEMPAAPVTVSATFVQPAKYSITYDKGNFTSATGTMPSNTEVAPGTNYTINSTDKLSLTGYTFKGWNTDKNASVGLTNIIVNDNITLYAIFTINSHNVTFTPSITGGSIKVNNSSTSPVSVEYNSSVTITVTPTSKYFKLTKLTYNDTDIKDEMSFTMPDADVTIVAEFTEDTKYTITFADKLHGESVSAKSVYSGETFNFPVIADKTATTSGTCEQIHYHFMGWVLSTHEGTIDAEDIKTGTSAAVESAATYYAVWAKEEL